MEKEERERERERKNKEKLLKKYLVHELNNQNIDRQSQFRLLCVSIECNLWCFMDSSWFALPADLTKTDQGNLISSKEQV